MNTVATLELERPQPAKWRTAFHHDCFIRRSHQHWVVHGKVLEPSPDERAELKGLDLTAYEFQESFVEAQRAYL